MKAPDQHHREGQHGHANQAEKTTSNMLVVEELRLRLVVEELIHAIGIPTECAPPSGTSAKVAPPWDFCKARR